MKIPFFSAKLIRMMVVGLLLIPMSLVQAATVTVCAVGCDQTSIDTAIAAANSGDTIQLDNGIYHVNLNIAKNLTLQGKDAGQTILDGSDEAVPIIRNTVVTVPAGAIVRLENLTVRYGSSYQGGGIYNSGDLTLERCIISQNDAEEGGGIYNNGALQIKHSTIDSNSASSYGSGAAIFNENTTQLFSSTVSNNTSDDNAIGSAITNSGVNASLAISQSTLSRNTTAKDVTRGSFAVFNIDGKVYFTDTTISKDTPKDTIEVIGSAAGSFIITNTIIANLPGAADCYLDANTTGVAPVISSQGGNIAGDKTCHLNHPSDQENVTNIHLGPLQVNAPGTTATHALLPGSAAIDAIPNCIFDQDQRGVLKPQGPGCDSGAYELRIPEATNDSYTTTQAQALKSPTPSLLANDISPEGLTLEIAGLPAASHGFLFTSASGTFQYIPETTFIGQDSFTYTVTDGVHSSNSATVTLNVQAINHTPIAQNDSYSAFADHTLTVTALDGVLANDSDQDANTLTAVNVIQPAHGSVTLNTDGSFSYNPTPGYIGADSFTYQANDGQIYSDVVSVAITVNSYQSTITIALDNQPDSAANFHFTGDLGNFILDDITPNDRDTYSNSKTFDVVPGTYTVTEKKLAGWLTVANGSCSPLANTSVEVNRKRIHMTIGAGENITCTFVNMRPGRLIVRSFNDRNHDQQRNKGEPWLSNWKMQLYRGSALLAAAKTTNSAGTSTFKNLLPNIYTVCEVPKPNWQNTSPPTLDSIYEKPCYTVNIGPGQTVEVSFGNSNRP